MGKLSRKRKVIIGIILIVVCIGSFIGFKYYDRPTKNIPPQQSLSYVEKQTKIKDCIKNKDYNKAKDLNFDYFKDEDNATYDKFIDLINLCQMGGYKLLDAENYIKQHPNLYKYNYKTTTTSNDSNNTTPPVKVPDLQIINVKWNSKSDGYSDINIQVKNNSNTTINYVKINIFFKDLNGNVIQSTWTNDDSAILSGATQTIKKFCKVGNDAEKVHCEIATYN